MGKMLRKIFKNDKEKEKEPESSSVKSNKPVLHDGEKKRVVEQQKEMDSELKKRGTAFAQKWENPTSSNSQLQDFKLYRTLGMGAFGRVMLTKHIPTNKHYALKIIDKDKVVKSRRVEHMLNEKKVLQCCDHECLVNLHFYFQDNSNLYLVMEFVKGGEMFTLLRKARRYPDDQARFYAVQVILAFEYLHSLDIVYRDLKPENLLIAENGYLKVTDLGFAKKIKSRTYTLCGTPEYLAPEIIRQKAYGKPVDWWTVGVLIYEMNAGYPPFDRSRPYDGKSVIEINTNDPIMRMYVEIVNLKYRMSSKFNKELSDLIRGFLQVDLTKRLGNLKNGALDIKLHPWFRSADWIAILQQKVKPPWVPKLKGDGDDSQFDKFEEEDLVIAPNDKHGDIFKDF